MLVTSRETRRWIIPKGWPIRGLTAHASAAREALEEAGLIGQVDRRPIGSYRYRKRLADGSAVLCKVQVFTLRVIKQLPSWPEQAERSTRWFLPEAAAKTVDERELGGLIRDLRPHLLKARRKLDR
jgi:8-oxo-dGTP pyrophosphatase MutT (NUDIX family)